MGGRELSVFSIRLNTVLNTVLGKGLQRLALVFIRIKFTDSIHIDVFGVFMRLQSTFIRCDG